VDNFVSYPQAQNPEKKKSFTGKEKNKEKYTKVIHRVHNKTINY